MRTAIHIWKETHNQRYSNLLIFSHQDLSCLRGSVDRELDHHIANFLEEFVMGIKNGKQSK